MLSFLLALVCAQEPPLPGDLQPFLDRHCVTCHGESAPQADLRLDAAFLAEVGDPLVTHADDWDWLRERVEFGDMPPAGEPGPSADERERFVRALGDALRAAGGADPATREGGPALAPPADLRRLTRAEYANAVRDLFGVSFRAAAVLPEDAVGHGFDHVGSAQSLSEADFVKYLVAAERVAARALPVAGEEPNTERVTSERIDAQGHHSGAAWRWSNGTAWARVPVPRPGEYRVRARVWGTHAGADPILASLGFDGADESAPLEVPFAEDAPGVVEALVEAPGAGDLRVGVRFLNDAVIQESADGPRQDRNLAIEWIEVTGPFGAAEPTEFSRALVAAAEAARGDDGLARVLAPLAALVWRTPDPPMDAVRALVELSDPADAADLRLRLALTGMLASPRFVFRLEDGAGEADARGARALTSVELATRLAGLVWSSVPDAALFERARATDLRAPEVLARLVDEMLADPRAEAFVRGFGEQWLQLRDVFDKRPDRKAFPGFDRALARSMREETLRVLADSLTNDRDLWDLVDGDSTFVDARLAAHYGLEGHNGLEGHSGAEGPDPAVDGDGWSRVSLTETPRRGLLGHGSVLLVTSEATRTSPVKRGRWVLDVLLGSAPPPPPPGVDSLDQQTAEVRALSVRERLELHRASPDCAACHRRMDPIGFGLESFDPVGAVRAADDDHGTLPDGRTFQGPRELAAVLRGDERFLAAVVERLAVYALGRAVEREERAFLAAVVARLDPERPTLRSALHAIVASDAFTRIRKH